MTLEQQLLKSIAFVQEKAIARRAVQAWLEPRPKFRRYKIRCAIRALEEARELFSQVVEPKS